MWNDTEEPTYRAPLALTWLLDPNSKAPEYLDSIGLLTLDHLLKRIKDIKNNEGKNKKATSMGKDT